MSFADVLLWLGVTMFCGALAGWVVTRYLARRARRKPPPDPADPTDLRVPSFERSSHIDFSPESVVMLKTYRDDPDPAKRMAEAYRQLRMNHNFAQADPEGYKRRLIEYADELMTEVLDR